MHFDIRLLYHSLYMTPEKGLSVYTNYIHVYSVEIVINHKSTLNKFLWICPPSTCRAPSRC